LNFQNIHHDPEGNAAMTAAAYPLNLLVTAPTLEVLAKLALATQDKLRSSLSEVCQLLGIADIGFASAAQFQRRRVKAGGWIFGGGTNGPNSTKLDSVFVVCSGFLKTLLIDEAGNERILGFPMRGDLLGIDGLHADFHPSQAVAITECEVIVIPVRELITLAHQHALLETWFYCAMSRELAREHAVVGLLSTLGAEARVARFLVALGERFGALGYSCTQFNLHMTRQEIGSYLGLTLETVSRSFSALHDAHLIKINQRAVTLFDTGALRAFKKLTPLTKLYSVQSHAADHATLTKRNNSIWSSLTNPH
jgi:CRP/FNR family transcriptional regulator